jgi:hypothetical protein
MESLVSIGDFCDAAAGSGKTCFHLWTTPRTNQQSFIETAQHLPTETKNVYGSVSRTRRSLHKDERSET